MKSIFKQKTLTKFLSLPHDHPIIFTIGLSWFYALCSQIVVPLPFNIVPISLQPLPLLLCAYFLGKTAITAYVIYLAQGALGLPFFSLFRGGIVHLIGPTGGYLWGFLGAMIFINVFKHFMQRSTFFSFICGLGAISIYFTTGLLQLSFFVPYNKLLTLGLQPFLMGDWIKLVIWLSCIKKISSKNKLNPAP